MLFRIAESAIGYSGDKSYRLRLFRNDLTAEAAEGAQFEKRERNNSDTNGFVIIYLSPSG